MAASYLLILGVAVLRVELINPYNIVPVFACSSFELLVGLLLFALVARFRAPAFSRVALNAHS